MVYLVPVDYSGSISCFVYRDRNFVLILVLVDYGGSFEQFDEIKDIDCFNPCYSGLWRISVNSIVISSCVCIVLILVIVDYGGSRAVTERSS